MLGSSHGLDLAWITNNTKTSVSIAPTDKNTHVDRLGERVMDKGAKVVELVLPHSPKNPFN